MHPKGLPTFEKKKHKFDNILLLSWSDRLVLGVTKISIGFTVNNFGKN